MYAVADGVNSHCAAHGGGSAELATLWLWTTVPLKVTSDDSDRFTLVDYVAPPGFTAPPVLHHHTREDWAAYVLSGHITFVFSPSTPRPGSTGSSRTSPRP